MTTWYLDPEGGTDANAGTSFALRKKTIASMTLAAGDTVRIIADYGPQNLGPATWTEASGTVTLGAAATLTLDNCDAVWAPATGVTVTVTNAAYHKQGTSSVNLAVASAFTSGLLAYKAVSNLDLSAYACVSLWLSTAGAALAQPVQIALCSDSAGAVPLVTLSASAPIMGFGSVAPIPVLFENGGAALPSGVNSIALYANNGKPFSISGNIFLDNVIATKAYGMAGHLSHACLFGKNTPAEPEWYPIMSIDGTTVVLGNYADYGTATPTKPYRGVGETTNTFALAPLRTRMTTTTAKLTGVSGTPTAPLTFTGGWNRTDMSTQTGTSWLSGESMQTYGFYNSSGYGWVALPDSTIGFAGYTTGAVYVGTAAGATYRIAGISNCAAILTNASASATVDLDLGNLVRNGTSYSLTGLQTGKFKLRIRRITGVSGNGFAVGDVNDDTSADVVVGSIDNCNFGFSVAQASRLRLRGLTLKNNSSASVSPVAGPGSEIILDRPILGDATVCLYGTLSGQVIRCTNVAGNAWDSRVYTRAVTQTMTQGTVHGATAQSLSLQLNDYLGFIGLPYTARIGRVACVANKTVTFSTWMRRSTQFVNAGIMVQAGSVAGIVDAQAQGVAANATWEQVTLSFTPTENGVVDVFAYMAAQASVSANGTVTLFGDTSVSST